MNANIDAESVTNLIGDTLQKFGALLPAGEDDITPILDYAIKRASRPAVGDEIEFDEDPRWAYPELTPERAYLAWPCAACGTRRDEHASEPEQSVFPDLDITDHDFIEAYTPVTVIVQPPSTPPADDVREACQQPPVGWHCSREAGHDGPCAARPIGQHDHKWKVHQGWAKCTLCGLEDEDPKWEPSSPPADDVREALRDIVRGGSYSRFPDDLPYADVVDRILAVFEVRPHGTVTDAGSAS